MVASTQSRRIRVLDGPLRDSTYNPSARLTIGRSWDCDIQLVHDGVSRQHACISTNLDGTHVLVDLDSTNGTFIGQHRIDRIVLEEGTTFEIMRNRLIYETIPAVAAAPVDAPVSRDTGTPTHRTTIAYQVFKGSQARKKKAGFDDPQGRTVESVPRRYRGDLIGDIATFRSMRARLARGESQSPAELTKFRRLQQRMMPAQELVSSPGSKQRPPRFSCRIAASLRLFTGEELPVELTEAGVDGARISVGRHSILPNTLLWLAITQNVGGRIQTLVFPGRAAWAQTRFIGFSFSDRSKRDKAQWLDRTQRTMSRFEFKDMLHNTLEHD